MIDEILPYYDAELRYLRELGQHFAAAHPKIAGRLRLGPEGSDDPLVGQLLQGVAFLNARTRRKLDDEFPELTEALLETLHPHLASNIPSFAMVALKPQPTLTAPLRLAAGTMLETEPVDQEICHYRTVFDLEVMPIAIEAASLTARPFIAPTHPHVADAASVLRLSLVTLAPDASFTALGVDRLRLCLSGPIEQALKLHELLTVNLLGLAFATGPDDPGAVFVEPARLRPCGFAEGEMLLPPHPGADPGYALLTELFAFPRKFLFFDIEGLSARTLLDCGRHLEVFIYCDVGEAELERAIGARDFALFATPVVNLFARDGEPVAPEPPRAEVRLVADARRERTTEIYRIDAVEVSNRETGLHQPQPLFAPRVMDAAEAGHFYTVARRPAVDQAGDDLFLSLVDHEGRLDFAPGDVIETRLTCTNRDLPMRLPAGAGRPRFRLSGVEGLTVECLTPPTPPLRAVRGPGIAWRLLAALNLNHLSLTQDGQARPVLASLLALYDRSQSNMNRALRKRIVEISATAATARAPLAGPIVMVSGIDVTMVIDDRRLSGSGAFLMLSVLDRFLGGWCAVNAFTRLRVRLRHEADGWHAWPARSGQVRLI